LALKPMQADRPRAEMIFSPDGAGVSAPYFAAVRDALDHWRR
jgi:hypothetical protein